MRIFLRAIGGFLLGLVVTYLVVVFGLLWYADISRTIDSHGVMIVDIVFRIGPLAGILGGTVCAIVVSRSLGRRDHRRAKMPSP
jgi:hypothetical protein